MELRSIKDTVGIIGDGQLALMLADSLTRYKIPFLCLAESPDSPMALTYPSQTTRDSETFQQTCSVFTLENEFLSVEKLIHLLKSKSPTLFPELESYQHFSNKISQRTLYASLGISSPKWMPVRNEQELTQVLLNFPFPFVLKASAGGYDGKGVRVIRNEAEWKQALNVFALPLLIEEKIQIKQELAQGFVQDKARNSTLLPLVDTVQVEGICQFVYYPAETSEQVKSEIEAIIKKLIQKPLVGIFNFEFFVDTSDRVFINEGAPRPHNSQHLTIDASDYSQFDLLALTLAGVSGLPKSVTTKPSSMVNILGKSQGPGYKLTLPVLPGDLKVVPKLYGKKHSSPGRKMGHVNLVDPEGKHELKMISRKIFREYDL